MSDKLIIILIVVIVSSLYVYLNSTIFNMVFMSVIAAFFITRILIKKVE